jgi:hypothetical protein
VFQTDADPMEALVPAHREAGGTVDPARLKQLLREILGR